MYCTEGMMVVGLLQRWLVFFYTKKDWVIFEFTGSVFLEEMRLWMKTFTNFMFVITAKSLDDPETKACSTEFKLEKVLLDTDSLSLKKTETNPWQVHLVFDRPTLINLYLCLCLLVSAIIML